MNSLSIQTLFVQKEIRITRNNMNWNVLIFELKLRKQYNVLNLFELDTTTDK